MLLQTNSYIVPNDKRAEHARQIRRFRQTLLRLGCDHFEVYEQVGPNWSNSESTGRYVQIMRFVDRKHQLAVQAAERNDPTAQAVIADFCELINFPYQQQQGLFAVGFYHSLLPTITPRQSAGAAQDTVTDAPVEAFSEASQGNGDIEHDEPAAPAPVSQAPARASPVEHPPLSIASDDADFDPFEGEISDSEPLLMDELEPDGGAAESRTGQSDVDE